MKPHVATVALAMGLLSLFALSARADETKPNIIIIYADDLGYGDLSCYGHPTIATPNLDRLAAEGQRWTNFYSAACVCTPSRAALMSGRLPIRNGMCSDRRRVLFPESAGGLPPTEVTIAEVLKPAGYATAAVGKWHLGHLPQYLPTSQGFDSYFGIPYSNDMDRLPEYRKMGRIATFNPKVEYFNVPLMRNEEIVERPADQTTITRRYTDETIRFVKANKDRPFFCYLAHNLPHVPLFCSDEFRNRSLRGLYGDVVEEIDADIGRIVETLKDLKIDDRTMVFFCSDNGPWLVYREHGGSAGLLRGGKGGTFEGGMREPGIFWWPGKIKPGTVRQMGATLDLLPTCAKLAGAELPADRVLDGYDLSPVLLGSGDSPRQTMFYYRGTKLQAVRHGQFKAHFITRPEYGPGKVETHEVPLLFDLGHDPGEQYDVAEQHPEVVAEIRRIAEQHTQAMVPGECQLEKMIGE